MEQGGSIQSPAEGSLRDTAKRGALGWCPCEERDLALGEMRKVELGAPRSSNTGCYEESHEGPRELTGVLEAMAMGRAEPATG